MAKSKKHSARAKKAWETRRKNAKKAWDEAYKISESQVGPALEINAEDEVNAEDEALTLTQAIAKVEIALAKLKELL